MQSIKDKVAIVGMGCTKFGERWDQGMEDLIVEACYEALDDASLETKDIQAAWFGNQSTAYSGQTLAHALKLEYLPVTRVENLCGTATDALRNACFSVASGVYDVVLVCGAEKFKDTGYAGLPPLYGMPGLTVSGTDPLISGPGLFALSATRYFYQYGISYEDGKRLLAKISVKNHYNGSLNPKAHFQREVTIDKVMNAPMISWPLGLFDCCGNSDGASAAIITRRDMARSFGDDYILVKSLTLASGAMQGQLQREYDFTHFDEAVTAARAAYEEAGVSNPRGEIDMAIVHDCFTITELITYEDLGFCPRGEARNDVDEGFFTLEGGLPVNTDGGLKCFGHPVGASGLRMIYEVYKQLQGKSGPRQLRKIDLGLTHNLGGQPGCFTCAIGIFGRED